MLYLKLNCRSKGQQKRSTDKFQSDALTEICPGLHATAKIANFAKIAKIVKT